MISASLIAAALVVATPAATPQPFPGNTRSHYLNTVDASVLQRAGMRDARDAAAAGITDALVVLAGGDPVSDDGVRLPGSGVHASTSDVADAAVAYARGWRTRLTAPSLTLVVMAAAHGPDVTAAAGAAWARLVDSVARGVSGVDVRGGLDVEVEWAGAREVRSWLDGYLSSTGRGFVDVGACTCPPYAAVGGRWSLGALADVAWADGRGVVLPQIYATAGGNAREWATLAAWARRHHRGPVRLAGVLTEQAACVGPPPRPCVGIDVGPVTAWRQLSRASGQRLRWASDIGYLPVSRRLHGSSILRTTAYAAGAFLVAAAASTLVVVVVRDRRPPRRRRRARRRPRRTRRR